MVKKYLPLLRTSHYLKNLYIFLPLFFSGEILDSIKVLDTVPVFISFCFVASSIYIFNDLMDVEFDRQHPVKKKSRNLIRVQYRRQKLISLSFSYLQPRVYWLIFISPTVLIVIAGYFVLNVLYCIKFKNHALVDVVIVAIGFNLRIIAGGLASQILVSKWLMIMVFLLSLFQALSKRMDDLYLILKDPANQVRKSIHGYNIEFLQIVLSMLTRSYFGLLYYVYHISGNCNAPWR